MNAAQAASRVPEFAVPDGWRRGRGGLDVRLEDPDDLWSLETPARLLHAAAPGPAGTQGRTRAMEMGIGELSQRTQVKVPTIRYYEKVGLLPPGPRTEGNQRRYGQEAVERLKFIRRARDLGFEIDAIRALLRMAESPQASCHEADSIAREHLRDVEDRILQLVSLRAELRRMIDECSQGRVSECRVISILADHTA